jgi:hypothetical protein
MAYFSKALPAGYFMRRFGYKKGIIAGLLHFSIGSFIIAPASINASFYLFLIVFFSWLWFSNTRNYCQSIHFKIRRQRDSYFAKIDSDRLTITENSLLFKCDVINPYND